MPQPIVRSAKDADIPAIVALVNSAYRGDHSRCGWTTEADLLDGVRIDSDRLAEQIRHPHQWVLTYRSAERILGCVALEQRGDDLYFGMLTVEPTVQAQGIGKALLNAVNQEALARKCRTITISVIPQRTELVAWYARRGFALTGEILPFPVDLRFGIPRQPLSLVVMRKAVGG